MYFYRLIKRHVHRRFQFAKLTRAGHGTIEFYLIHPPLIRSVLTHAVGPEGAAVAEGNHPAQRVKRQIALKIES